MNKKNLRLVSLLLLFIMIMNSGIAYGKEWEYLLDLNGNYIYNKVDRPGVGSMGGEWAIIGLARSDYDVDEKYFDSYYREVEKQVVKNKGVFHEKKLTDNARVSLALTAIGRDPRDVNGYNLLLPLGDYEKVIWQGINGPIWALIALDSADYEIPINEEARVQSTRELFIKKILEEQLGDGGWALHGDKADADLTGMALQALSTYQDRTEVGFAIDRALEYMSEIQDEEAGFSSWGTQNSESVSQMIVALNSLGISIDDDRFTKNGNTLLDNLKSFSMVDGGFKHIRSEKEANQLASEQGLYALASLYRFENDMTKLYDMTDVSDWKADGINRYPANKHDDVRVPSVINKEVSFKDVKGKNKEAIEELASRGIINGKTNREFEPESNMTRAEFATIIVRGLGLPIQKESKFVDVIEDSWYYDFVNTASHYGIINGVSDKEFSPEGSITRQEAITMIARAAKLCGMETYYDETSIRNILAAFTDYREIDSWAKEAMAFGFKEKILDDEIIKIQPKIDIRRKEVAQILFNMLKTSGLIN